MSSFGNSDFLQSLGWAVLNSLWQMAFLWVIFRAMLSFGRMKSSLKSSLATVFLILGFIWFLFTWISHWLIEPNAIKSSIVTIASFEAGKADWNEQLQNALPYASLAYLTLLFVPTFQFIRNYRFVQLIRKTGLSKCHVDLRIFVQKFSERIGVRKPIHIYLSDIITSPVTIGFLKPIILMPVAAINNLTQKQVEAILLHELAHICRYDYLINLLMNFIKTILYFNPFVRLFARTIEREREKSCDDMVIQFQYDPHGYASALLLLERNNVMKQSMAIAASGHGNDLLNRIEKILGIEKRRSPDFKIMGGLFAGFICIIGLNALFFFSSPVIQNGSLSINTFSNPFYQLASGGNDWLFEKPVEREKQTGQAIQSVIATRSRPLEKKKTVQLEEVNVIPEEHFVYTQPEPVNGYVQVDSRLQLEPRLKKYQEEQVKGTVEATKKILEDGQWKQVEKNVADVLTQVEKEDLKEKYYSELEKVNWQKLEDNLRLAYYQINWDKVNTQLDVAISAMKLDSLKQDITITLNNLNLAENWMTQNKCETVPDTDLSLKDIKVNKQKIERQLRTINAIRNKKIIHL